MKHMFNIEGPLFQFLSRVGDLIILNVLFLVCCIPVITIGASSAALNKMTQDMVHDAESGVLKGFFQAFRANFKQATVVWVAELIVLVSLACDAILVYSWFPGNKLMYGILIALAVLVLCVSTYMIPLLVRYDNTLRQHLANAVILAIIKLPKTIAMVVLNALPLIVFLLSLNVFLQTMVFWLFIGFAFVAFMNSSMLKKVFAQIEGEKKDITLGT